MTEHQKTCLSLIEKSLNETMPENIEEARHAFQTTLSNKSPYIALLYGSCLNPKTQSKDSTPDFFVISSKLFAFHQNFFHALLNLIFTPNIYHFQIGAKKFSKYSVASLKQLQRESSLHAKDLFMLGRFSKRMLLSERHDPETEKQIGFLIYQAMQTVALKCLNIEKTYASLDDFCKACIRLSYLGDTRVESADKFEKIFLAHQSYYQNCYELILKDFEAQNLITLKNGHIESRIEDQSGKIQKFIKRSKRRAVFRWPKAMFTAKHWLDYVILKIERTQNISIEMTDLQKRWWPIFIWKHVFRVWKGKLIE